MVGLTVQVPPLAEFSSSVVEVENCGPYMLFLSDMYLYEFTELTKPTLFPFEYPLYQGPPDAPPVRLDESFQVLFPEFGSVLKGPNE